MKGTYYYLVMILDIFSRKVVGWAVFHGESAHNARTVLERAVLAEGTVNQPLVLHADNGSPFKGATLLEKMHDLGIVPSFSRPRVGNDNPYSEALFRTCKYRPGYPANGFASIETARQWVHGFVQWYNHEHRHSGIRLVTPAERHAGKDAEVLGKRDTINRAARAANLDPTVSPIIQFQLSPERIARLNGHKLAEAASTLFSEVVKTCHVNRARSSRTAWCYWFWGPLAILV